jgi:hypothetical protein
MHENPRPLSLRYHPLLDYRPASRRIPHYRFKFMRPMTLESVEKVVTWKSVIKCH